MEWYVYKKSTSIMFVLSHTNATLATYNPSHAEKKTL